MDDHGLLIAEYRLAAIELGKLSAYYPSTSREWRQAYVTFLEAKRRILEVDPDWKPGLEIEHRPHPLP